MGGYGGECLPGETPAFGHLLTQSGGDQEEESLEGEGDATSDISLPAETDEEDDDVPLSQSRPPSANEQAGSTDPNLFEVCKRAAAKLSIPWPAALDMEGVERDLYDGRRLPPAQVMAKQLLPAVPACMKEMRRFWSSPLKSKLPARGCARFEIQGMDELGLSGPPAVETSVAYHHHPDRRTISAASNISLPSKMERFTASTYQRIYCVMGLAVAGERSLWLNLSGLGEMQKAEVMDAPYDPTKGLFGPALEKMRETSTLRKQEDEAFNLCLPRKPAPRPPQPTQQSFSAPAVRPRQGGVKAHRPPPPTQQPNQKPRGPNPGQWPKPSFAAVAAKNRPPQTMDGKKKRSA